MRLGGGWFDRDHLSWHLCRGGGNPEASRASAEHEAQLSPATGGDGRGLRPVESPCRWPTPPLGTGAWNGIVRALTAQVPSPITNAWIHSLRYSLNLVLYEYVHTPI
jgi:hypothetical protein